MSTGEGTAPTRGFLLLSLAPASSGLAMRGFDQSGVSRSHMIATPVHQSSGMKLGQDRWCVPWHLWHRQPTLEQRLHQNSSHLQCGNPPGWSGRRPLSMQETKRGGSSADIAARCSSKGVHTHCLAGITGATTPSAEKLRCGFMRNLSQSCRLHSSRRHSRHVAQLVVFSKPLPSAYCESLDTAFSSAQ